MAQNHTRPLSDMVFPKTNVSNPNPSKNSKTGQTANKYSLRKKKIERMSVPQIEAVISKNEQLEEENSKLKAEVDELKEKLIEKSNDEQLLEEPVEIKNKTVQVSFGVSDTETQTVVAAEVLKVVQLEEENKKLKAALDDAEKKQIRKNCDGQCSGSPENVDSIGNPDNETHQSTIAAEILQESTENIVWIRDASIQVMVVACTVSVSTQTIIEDAVEVLESVDATEAVPKGVLFELLPWLEVVNRDYEFLALEKRLILDAQLQTDLIHTMADQMKTPDEYNFMKYFLARLFTRDFFVNAIAFNARKGKVQFKGTVIFHCFAVSMVMKYEKLKSNEEPEDEIVEQFKIKIQNFMTDFKLLVKRNPKNWPV